MWDFVKCFSCICRGGRRQTASSRLPIRSHTDRCPRAELTVRFGVNPAGCTPEPSRRDQNPFLRTPGSPGSYHAGCAALSLRSGGGAGTPALGVWTDPMLSGPDAQQTRARPMLAASTGCLVWGFREICLFLQD